MQYVKYHGYNFKEPSSTLGTLMRLSNFRRIPLIEIFLSRSEGLDHAEWVATGFMVASGVLCGFLSEDYGHDEPRVCLGDDQTEAERVPSKRRLGEALLRLWSSASPIPDLI